MKTLCVKWATYLSNHMWLYYLLNLTWGLLGTLMGSVIALVLIITGNKPIRYGPCYYFIIGKSWGGFEGVFFFLIADCMPKEHTEHTKEHEFGHSFQNALFGPFMIFVVLIPSIVRYWHQRIRQSKGLSNADYDSIWFEGSASEGGSIARKTLNIK